MGAQGGRGRGVYGVCAGGEGGDAWGAQAGGTWSFPGECGSVGVVES